MPPAAAPAAVAEGGDGRGGSSVCGDGSYHLLSFLCAR